VTQIYLATAGHRDQHETRQGKASEFRSLHSCSSLILTASVTSVGWPVRSRVGSVGLASLVGIPAGDVAGVDLLATKMGGMPATGSEQGGRARLSIF
jgi:hypothetical protein